MRHVEVVVCRVDRPCAARIVRGGDGKDQKTPERRCDEGHAGGKPASADRVVQDARIRERIAGWNPEERVEVEDLHEASRLAPYGSTAVDHLQQELGPGGDLRVRGRDRLIVTQRADLLAHGDAGESSEDLFGRHGRNSGGARRRGTRDNGHRGRALRLRQRGGGPEGMEATGMRARGWRPEVPDLYRACRDRGHSREMRTTASVGCRRIDYGERCRAHDAGDQGGNGAGSKSTVHMTLPPPGD